LSTGTQLSLSLPKLEHRDKFIFILTKTGVQGHIYLYPYQNLSTGTNLSLSLPKLEHRDTFISILTKT